MPIIQLLNEKPMSMAEMKQKIAAVEKRDGTLNFRATRVKDYVEQFAAIKPEEAVKIRERMANLDIPRLRDRHITKIIDVNPKDVNSLKIVFAGEALTLKPEEFEKIFGALKEK